MVRRLGLLFPILFGLAASLRAQEEDYYRIVTLPVPETVPFEVSGLEVLPDGKIAAAIRRGEVWLVEGAYKEPPEGLRFRRIAQALHEPLGLIRHGDSLYLAQRSELTRLRDLDGDGVIDEYLTVTNDWGITGNYHEYAYGPRVDGEGNFWLTLNASIGKRTAGTNAWRGWAVKVTPQGRLLPVATGLRSPCGIGMNGRGDVFTTDQQGGWVATCALHHLEEGDFYGHPDGLKSCSRPGSPVACPERIPTGINVVEAAKQIPGFKLPAVWFPYRKMGRSSTDLAWDQTEGRFGPFEGQLFVGDFTDAMISRVFLERVDGGYQGACFPFREGFRSAVVRMVFGADGSLFVGETNRGWNSMGTRSYGLERLVWTGSTPFEVREMRALSNGFRLTFTRPVDPDRAARPDSYRMSSYTYLYHPDYGSPEVETKELNLTTARVAAGGRSVDLTVEGLRPGYVHELHLPGVVSVEGESLLHPRAYYTLNRIPSAAPDADPGNVVRR